jgi:hypothetical protein
MKKNLSIASVVVGVLAYLFIITTTIRGTGEGLSISTFALWSAIGWITVFTIFQQNANASVPLIYSLGATAVTFVLIHKGQYGKWSTFDSVIAVLVVACLVLWLVNGARVALIMSVVAGSTASLPYLIMTWQFPDQSPFLPNIGFFLANALALAGAKAWTIEDRLYPFVNTVLTAMLLIPCVM